MADLFSIAAAEEAHGRRRQMFRTAFGPTIAAALADPAVIEVMVNPDGKLWIERASVGRQDTGEHIASTEAERIIRLVAAHVRREVTDKAPIVSAELPETGERFEGVMPPVSPAPCFAVRKPADVLYRLSDYVAARIMSPRQAEALAVAVRERRNILVVGGTSSGKTTLVNALLAEIADLGERVVILEDTREQLVQEAVVTVPRDLIVQAIDVVVFLEGRGVNRRIETVLELNNLDDDGDYLLKPLARPTLHTV